LALGGCGDGFAGRDELLRLVGVAGKPGGALAVDLGDEEAGVVAEVVVRGADEGFEEGEYLGVGVAECEVPEAAFEVRARRRQRHPGEERDVVGPGRADGRGHVASGHRPPNLCRARWTHILPVIFGRA
jgi:hypothetical protein